ncbi:MAG: hypothetical protein LBS61_06330 [Endomicrobium sp.]|nr:hypothetical protein [Endomicrobium sp.]
MNKDKAVFSAGRWGWWGKEKGKAAMLKKIVVMTLVFTMMFSQMTTAQGATMNDIMQVIEAPRFLAMPICTESDIAVLEEIGQVCPEFWAKVSAMKPEEKKAYEIEILEDFHRQQKEYQSKHLNAESEQETEPEPQTVWQRIKGKTFSAVGFVKENKKTLIVAVACVVAGNVVAYKWKAIAEFVRAWGGIAGRQLPTKEEIEGMSIANVRRHMLAIAPVYGQFLNAEQSLNTEQRVVYNMLSERFRQLPLPTPDDIKNMDIPTVILTYHELDRYPREQRAVEHGMAVAAVMHRKREIEAFVIEREEAGIGDLN